MAEVDPWDIVVADIETNGLLDSVTKIHCLSVRSVLTGENRSFADQPGYPSLDDGFALLARAKRVIGHNFLTYDARVIRKLRPARDNIPDERIIDTLILSQLLWPEIRQTDFAKFHKGTLPGKLIGRHGLEAWGWRMGIHKGEYGKKEDAWDVWTPEMSSYMDQDTYVNLALWRIIKKKLATGCLPPDAARLEHEVASICQDMTETGWPFNIRKAAALEAELRTISEELEGQLQHAFPPQVKQSVIIPKANNSRYGYRKGVPFTRSRTVKFNPGSADHVAERLLERYGWKAPRNPETGNVILGDDVLKELPFPEIGLLRRYLKVNKAFSQLSSGKKAWLRVVGSDGRMHGRYATCRAVTTRAAHMDPNLAQVPSVAIDDETKLPIKGEAGGWGYECRELFEVPAGWVQVGVDMSGIELRCLANRLAKYDDLLYATTILTGDIHTMNQKAAGLPSRAVAKTFIYDKHGCSVGNGG